MVFNCPSNFCKSGTFEHLSQVFVHVLQSHAENSLQLDLAYKCGVSGCPQVFLVLDQLLGHFELGHSDHVPFPPPMELVNLEVERRNCVCPKCGKKFARPWNYKRHVQSVNLKCHISKDSKDCTEKASKNTNEQVQKKKKVNFTCDRCGKLFRSGFHLNRHKKSLNNPFCVRKAPAVFVCAVCGLHSKSKAVHDDHARTHTMERPFSCQNPSCDKAYKRKHTLELHLKNSQCCREFTEIDKSLSRPFKCPDCAANYKSRERLESHRATGNCVLVKKVRIEGNKKGNYECAFCHRSFSFLQHLQRHKNFTHADEMLQGEGQREIMEDEEEMEFEKYEDEIEIKLEDPLADVL